jgi:hypothetical protein
MGWSYTTDNMVSQYLLTNPKLWALSICPATSTIWSFFNPLKGIFVTPPKTPVREVLV